MPYEDCLHKKGLHDGVCSKQATVRTRNPDGTAFEGTQQQKLIAAAEIMDNERDRISMYKCIGSIIIQDALQ
jgi:hypothetical protein